MSLFVCVKCKKDMTCLKNGIGVDYGNYHVYPGDVFECRKCGIQIIRTNPQPINDKDYKTQDAYLVHSDISKFKRTICAPKEKEWRPLSGPPFDEVG